MSVDLRHFRSFVVVAEEGNIGRAAGRLFITQPALSRQIQQLERRVGTTLLLRSAHGVELTEAGREMLVKARRTLEAVDEAMAVGRDDEPSGRLTLGLPMAGQRDQWYGVCQAFTARYPQIEVEVRQAMSESLQRQVASGELDAALALAPARLPSLDYELVRTDRLSVWMNRRAPAGRSRARSSWPTWTGAPSPSWAAPGAAASGFNAAVRDLFEGTGVAPEFVETDDVYPARAVSDPGYLGISPPLDFPGDVVGVPLVPARTMAYEYVQRAESDRAAVRAFGPFAREHFGAGRGAGHARRACVSA